MGGVVPAVAGILAAVVGLAIISVLVSKNAVTGQVVAATGTAFSGILGAAVAPVTGTSGTTATGTTNGLAATVGG